MKRNENKRFWIYLVSLILVFISLIFFYFSYLSPYFDNKRIETINQVTESMQINKYSGALREDISVSEIESLEKEINKIKDGDKRTALLQKTSKLINQAKLQTTTKEELLKIENEEDFNKISLEKIRAVIDNASKINNTKIRSDLTKSANIVLDRYVFADRSLNEAKNLSSDNIGLYYSLLELSDNIYYESVKSEVKAILDKVKKDIDLKEKNKKQEENKEEQEILNQAAGPVTFDFDKGTSEKISLKPIELELIRKSSLEGSFQETPVFVIDKNKLLVYTVSFKENNPLSLKDSFNIISNHSSKTQDILGLPSIGAQNQLYLGTTIVSDSVSTNILVSTSTLNQIKNKYISQPVEEIVDPSKEVSEVYLPISE